MADPLPQPAPVSGRGKLKIFFGAFPGAGKTDAMLLAARRLREAGRDVVIAVLDMHGRDDVQAATAGFELLAPPLGPDGKPLASELDIDAVIRRRPEVALVDDLAH